MESTKVLGQVVPAPTTLTALYTVPALTGAVVSTLVVCNQNTTPMKFRISLAVAGAGDTPAQYLFYDTPLIGNNSVTLTLGIALGAADVVRVYSDTANVSFNAFGVEVA